MAKINSFLIAMLLFPTLAMGQNGNTPPISELHKAMNAAVKDFNSKMPGTKVDESTVLRFMTYDEATPMLGYSYETKYFATTGKRNISADYAERVRQFNIEKTCSSRFKSLMRSYGMQVVHSFSDATTGKNLLEVVVTFNDCK